MNVIEAFQNSKEPMTQTILNFPPSVLNNKENKEATNMCITPTVQNNVKNAQTTNNEISKNRLSIILRAARKEYKKIKLNPISQTKNWKDHKKEVKNIINLWKQSGLSLDKFCTATNIIYSSLYYYVSYIILDQMKEPHEITEKVVKPKVSIANNTEAIPCIPVTAPSYDLNQLNTTNSEKFHIVPKTQYEAEIISIMKNDPRMEYSISFLKKIIKEKSIDEAIDNLIELKVIKRSKDKKNIWFAFRSRIAPGNKYSIELIEG